MTANYLDAVALMIREEVPIEALPDHSDAMPLFRTYAVLLEALGQEVSARDVHNAWVAWMLDRDEIHDALVPYEALAPEVAKQDLPFVQAIHRVTLKLATSRGQ